VNRLDQRWWLRLGTAVAALAVLGVFALAGRHYLHDDFSVAGIQAVLVAVGFWAPLLFMVAYALRPLVLLPASVLTISAGLIWGPVLGTVYTVIGATASAVVAFLLARTLGREFVARRAKGKLGAVVERLTREEGFKVVFSLRLIPLFPYDVISYASGLTAVRLGPYFAASLIGTIPASFAFAYLGASLDGGGWREWVLTAVMLGTLAAAPWVHRWVTGRRGGDAR
jgi:uncharacterized membrane protein YdjX (TVP38/TMEM64 family)